MFTVARVQYSRVGRHGSRGFPRIAQVSKTAWAYVKKHVTGYYRRFVHVASDDARGKVPSSVALQSELLLTMIDITPREARQARSFRLVGSCVYSVDTKLVGNFAADIREHHHSSVISLKLGTYRVT